jgi:transposase-like protein
MTETGRMTAAQAVDKLMMSEHADVIRESVRFMVDALMDAEVSELAGAEYGERAPERRSSQRNGYRSREWDTRVGAIELAIPRLRSGSGDLRRFRSRAGAPSRRSSPWFRRPTSTAFRPARSTGSSSRSVCA